MKQFITTITVLFVALLFPNNGKANACHTAANGLFNKFNPAVQTHLETDSVVEVEALADGDTIYRYVYSPPLKTIFQHTACIDKLYADSFYKVQKSSHSSFEVICCGS